MGKEEFYFRMFAKLPSNTALERMRVTFWRPDVFRIEKGLKVHGTNQLVKVDAPAANATGDVKVEICGVTGSGFKGQVRCRAYELWLHTGAKPCQVLVDGGEVLPISAEGGLHYWLCVVYIHVHNLLKTFLIFPLAQTQYLVYHILQ